MRTKQYDGVLEYWVLVREPDVKTGSITKEQLEREKDKARVSQPPVFLGPFKAPVRETRIGGQINP